MLPKKNESGEVVLVCSSCDLVSKGDKVEGYTVIKKPEPKEDITVVEEGVGASLPTTRVNCPGCGHNRAYWWMRQTRAADEPTTRFYRCVKCGKVWREYA
jgi:DNA-directed RNA polymerase subunit M